MRALAILLLVPGFSLGLVAGATHLVGPLDPVSAQQTSLVWANRVFTTQSDFESWLVSRGSNYELWSQLHPAAARHFDDASRSDRKSTRLNSSHERMSYAVFCLKKKISRLRSCVGCLLRFARCGAIISIPSRRNSSYSDSPSYARSPIGFSGLASLIFFFNDTATTEIYTLSLHDALPISHRSPHRSIVFSISRPGRRSVHHLDRKSTRLNSSHEWISYAVFCLKKKTK